MVSVVGGIGKISDKAMDLTVRAFVILTGYFISRTLVGFVGNYVPQVAALGNVAVIILGLIGAVYTSDVISDMFVGAALMGMIRILEQYAMPALEGVMNELTAGLVGAAGVTA